MSRRAWIVFALILMSFTAFRVRAPNAMTGDQAVDGQVTFQILLWGVLGLLGVQRLLKRDVDWRLIRRGPLMWYCVFILVALVSVGYSSSPLFSAYYALQLVIFVVLVLSGRPSEDKLIAFATAYALANWLLVAMGELGLTFGQEWILPAEAMYVRYGGSPGEIWRLSTAIGHPSQISMVSTLAAICIFARGKSFGRFFAPLLTLHTLTCLSTVSRTAIAGLAAGLIIVAMWQRRSYVLGLMLTTVTAIVLMLPPIQNTILGFLLRGQSQEDLVTFTGRSAIYDVAIERAWAHWWGEGFRSLRASPLTGNYWGQGVSHAHNFLLQALIEVGIWGAAAAVAVLLALARAAFQLAYPRSHHQSYRHLGTGSALGACCPILAFSLLDSGFTVNLDPFIAVFIYFLAVVRTRQMFNRQEISGPRGLSQNGKSRPYDTSTDLPRNAISARNHGEPAQPDVS